MATTFISREPDSVWYDLDARQFRYGFLAVSWPDDSWEDEVRDWCANHIGEYGPKGLWYVYDYTVWLRKDRHAMEFKLRWM